MLLSTTAATALHGYRQCTALLLRAFLPQSAARSISSTSHLCRARQDHGFAFERLVRELPNVRKRRSGDVFDAELHVSVEKTPTPISIKAHKMQASRKGTSHNKLVVTGQARSEPPDSWYEQQRAAAVQTEKQKLQQQFLSPPTRNSQPDSQLASQSTSQSASPLTGWTPTAATPEPVNMPATPDLVVQKDSQQTEIGTPDESNEEDSQNTQFQSQLDPDTPEELFSPMDEQQMWAMINGPQ
jgi:hypothetical protein